MEQKVDKDLINKAPPADNSKKMGDIVLFLAQHIEDPRFDQLAGLLGQVFSKSEAAIEPTVETKVPDVSAQSMSVSEESESASEEKPVVKKPTKPKENRVDTVAVQVAKESKPTAPFMKKKINDASKTENIGSTRTPIKLGSKSVDANTFFSPGGTTLHVETKTITSFKKKSGEAFVETTNTQANNRF